MQSTQDVPWLKTVWRFRATQTGKRLKGGVGYCLGDDMATAFRVFDEEQLFANGRIDC